MDYICPVCDKRMPRDLSEILPHTEEHITEIIKRDHPDWVEADGVCKRCHEYYKSQLHPKEDKI
ncbi:MAG: hypothetical protein HQ558_03255 [Candidatus Omnitrophica bacterium]|nr:hypothetical protein [Candidatus Omnitrophota bacterium]